MKRILCMLVFLLWGAMQVHAQYISRSEPMPYVCPVVCQGGTTVLRIFQIQNIPVGQRIQALLSNASGSFVSGTQVLEADRFSTNGGSTWQNGPYVVSGNISELLIEITIPLATPPGSAYKVKIRTSGTYVSSEVYQCPGTGITVTPSIVPLPPLPENAQGTGQWIGHVYTWVPGFPGLLNSPALVNAQDFFNSANYKGHVLVDPLSFDINLSGNGGIPGSWNNGTSIACGATYTENYSMRLLRHEDFSAGLYRFEVRGDDGIRLSIDGGATWLLNSFIEQTYDTSYKTSDVAFPGGVCVSGGIDIVIEYFQSPANARITFTVTPLPGGSNPTVTSEPTDLQVCPGSAANFSVGVNGSGQSFSWEQSTDGGVSFLPLSDNAMFDGSGTSSLKITTVQATMHQNQFRCKVSGSCGGTVVSQSAKLSVKEDAKVIQQPTSLTVCEGAAAQFTIAANGYSGLRWQMNSGSGFVDLADGANYQGSGTTSLKINSAGNSGGVISFRCLLSGGCQGDLYSNQVSLTVQAGPTFITQPLDFAGCANLNAQLSVQTSGTVSAHQWQISTDNGLSYTNVPAGLPYTGQTTNQLKISPSGAAPAAAMFRCVISGACGSLSSSAARLNVNPLPNITVHPVDQPFCEGENIVFAFVATGTISSYQWQLSTDAGDTYTDLSAGAPYSGTQTAVLTINPALAAFTGNAYRCKVSGCNEDAFTNKAFIQVSRSATVTQQPAGFDLCQGEAGNIQINASGADVFQWQRQGAGGFVDLTDGAAFTGTQTETLLLTGTEGGTFRCLITGGCTNRLPSAEVQVNVLPALALTGQPADVGACTGQDAGFSINATGTQVLYRWQQSLNEGNTWEDITASPAYDGENTNSLKLIQISAGLDNSLYRCRIEGRCGAPLVSAPARLSVFPIPEILRQPVSQIVVCAGNETSFSTDLNLSTGIFWELSTDNGLSYTPIEESTTYQGVHTKILKINPTSGNMNQWLFRVRLSGCGQNVISEPAKLTVKSLPLVLAFFSQAEAVCPGEEANFEVQAAHSDAFEWELDTGAGYHAVGDVAWAQGSGSAKLHLQPVPAWETPVSFRLKLSNECGITEAGPFDLFVKKPVEIIHQPVLSGGCGSKVLEVQIGLNGLAQDLQWELFDTLNAEFIDLPEGVFFSGVQNSQLQVKNDASIDGLLLRCRINSCAAAIFSDPVVIHSKKYNPVYIPNSFSPNEDQENPEFKVYIQGDVNLKISVFSRWGELLYSSDDAQKGWDGTANGRPVPEDVYIYKVSIKQACGLTSRTGSVHLMR